ncbi:universal stress protein [Streptomyces sp. AS58]|uniref:universal stress protein n=1 Tax=Streptomyces sp. AS58 TaxID=1519489 RepID=UPI0006AEE018|nr:universal stress protein [Streptomyces sp. AS58]KOV49927.1 universal stress protein [Streptomyces sp. AS58]
MGLPLVVGLDGSDPSLLALDWSIDEAARHRLPVRLVHASRWERYEGARPSFSTDRPPQEVMAQHIIASGVERARLRNPEVKVSGEVLPDDAVSVLLRAGHDASALITGSRGRGAVTGLLLGSVGLSVAARAVCPAVVVRGSERNVQGAFHRVVVGVGDSTDGAGAVGFAVREAEVRGCVLAAVRAWRSPADEHVDHSQIADDAAQVRGARASDRLADALRAATREHPEVEVHRQPVEGPAHQVLLEESARADLIVVGAVRRHGHFGLQLGSVAHALLHYSQCPVAVIPQQV